MFSFFLFFSCECRCEIEIRLNRNIVNNRRSVSLCVAHESFVFPSIIIHFIYYIQYLVCILYVHLKKKRKYSILFVFFFLSQVNCIRCFLCSNKEILFCSSQMNCVLEFEFIVISCLFVAFSSIFAFTRAFFFIVFT